jgi:hypothetical protein
MQSDWFPYIAAGAITAAIVVVCLLGMWIGV